MKKRLMGMYRAGRSGQPMPVEVDRSVGSAVGGVALTIGMVAGCFFAIGAGGAAAERLFTPRTEREVRQAKRELELKGIRAQLAQ